MRSAVVAVLMAVLPQAAVAHEYWLEPNAFHLPPQEALSVTVRIGERLDGRGFPFDPRAYEQVYWSGPDGTLRLGALPVRAQLADLGALGQGLHGLAVASFPQSLTYESPADLRRFLLSVGQAEVLKMPRARILPRTDIRETYRRFSKLLVHFGARSGADTRVGLAREWVATGEGFVLFDGDEVAADHPVQLFCRPPEPGAPVLAQRLTTDGAGRIVPALPESAACLLNAVFIAFGGPRSDLTSDWVSLFFQSDAASK